MAKKNSKAKVENKAEKKQPENKSKAIDWSKQPAKITIVGLGGKHLVKGVEYPNIPKETAEIIVNKGDAKLK